MLFLGRALGALVIAHVRAGLTLARGGQRVPPRLRPDRAPRGAHSVIRGKPGQACKDGNDGGQHKQTAHQKILPEILESPHVLVGSLTVLGRCLVLLELAMSVHATHRLRLPCLRACHPFPLGRVYPLFAGREFRQNTTPYDKVKE